MQTGEYLLVGLPLAWFTWTDLRSHRIFWPAAAAAGAGGILVRLAGSLPVADGLWGVVPGLLLLAVSFLCRGIGKGDCFVLAGCGAVLGIARVLEMALTAMIFAAVWALVLLAVKRNPKERFAFMPFLLAAWICQLLT